MSSCIKEELDLATHLNFPSQESATMAPRIGVKQQRATKVWQMEVAKSSSHCKKYLKYNTSTAADRQGKEAFLFKIKCTVLCSDVPLILVYQQRQSIIYGTSFDVSLNYANKQDCCSSCNSVILQNNQIKGWFKHQNQRVKQATQ